MIRACAPIHTIADDSPAVRCCADTVDGDRAAGSDPAATYPDREVSDVETGADPTVGCRMLPSAAAEHEIDRPANRQQRPKVVPAPRAAASGRAGVQQRLQAVTLRTGATVRRALHRCWHSDGSRDKGRVIGCRARRRGQCQRMAQPDRLNSPHDPGGVALTTARGGTPVETTRQNGAPSPTVSEPAMTQSGPIRHPLPIVGRPAPPPATFCRT
jgi:hypothetical protein